MRKQEFIAKLRSKLFDLPYHEVKERINFYSEMIDDRIEDGLSEEDAVAKVGEVDGIVAQIREEFLSCKDTCDTAVRKRQRKVWQTVLIILGSPLWISLIATAAATALSLCTALWSVIAALWAAALSLAVAGVAAIPGAVIFVIKGFPLAALGFLGMGCVSAGLAIFSFYGMLFATKGSVFITKNTALWLINKSKR